MALAATLKYHQGGRLGWAVLTGGRLGLAVAARSFNLAVVPLFGIWLLWETYRLIGGVKTGQWWKVLKAGLAWGLPLAGWLLVVGGWNWLRFGSPLETGYGSELGQFTANCITIAPVL